MKTTLSSYCEAAHPLGDGAATDLIDLHVGGYCWRSFNMADAAIVSGVVIWLFVRRATASTPH